MVSNRLKYLFFLAIIVGYMHGIEEIKTGFYHNDPIMNYFSSFFHSIPQAVYYSSHIPWWLVIGASSLLVLGGKWTLRVLTVYGLVFFVELHHLTEAIRIMNYYPGIITTIVFEVVGFFYWKELIRSWGKNYGRD